MDWASSDTLTVIRYLLPGFVTAWVFYGLTAHPRSSPFERVVQALIFTVIVQALNTVVGGVLLVFGNVLVLGVWTTDTALVSSVLLALVAGLLFAWCVNNDYPHSLLRTMQVTTRTSFPSEWFSVFKREKRWAILNLSGGRRLYGWPEEWPDHSDSGHFVVDQPEWLLADGARAPLYDVAKIVVPVADVEIVELLNDTQEVDAEPNQLEDVMTKLIRLREEEQDHGK